MIWCANSSACDVSKLSGGSFYGLGLEVKWRGLTSAKANPACSRCYGVPLESGRAVWGSSWRSVSLGHCCRQQPLHRSCPARHRRRHYVCAQGQKGGAELGSDTGGLAGSTDGNASSLTSQGAAAGQAGSDGVQQTSATDSGETGSLPGQLEAAVVQAKGAVANFGGNRDTGSLRTQSTKEPATPAVQSQRPEAASTHRLADSGDQADSNAASGSVSASPLHNNPRTQSSSSSGGGGGGGSSDDGGTGSRPEASSGQTSHSYSKVIRQQADTNTDTASTSINLQNSRTIADDGAAVRPAAKVSSESCGERRSASDEATSTGQPLWQPVNALVDGAKQALGLLLEQQGLGPSSMPAPTPEPAPPDGSGEAHQEGQPGDGAAADWLEPLNALKDGIKGLVGAAAEPTTAPKEVAPPSKEALRAARRRDRRGWRLPFQKPAYTPVDFSANTGLPAGTTPFGAVVKKEVPPPDIGTVWSLLVLGLAYVHHSTTGFALPALLPLINEDLHLSDSQGALLTAGYTVLYALALVPVGFLADKADRPRLLAAGLATWSLLTMAASRVGSFGELLGLRVGFAVAQATQNPICFSLIPELFPRHRTVAMAGYNSAIYMGRALSFAAVILAGQLGVPTGDIGIQMVPIDTLDASRMSLLYTQGEMAAVTPIYDYDFSILYGAASESSWRQLLYWLGPPGLALGIMALLTVDEPRAGGQGFLGPPLASSRFMQPTTIQVRGQPGKAEVGPVTKAASSSVTVVPEPAPQPDMWQSVRQLVFTPSFQAVTFAAALNDVGSWALVSWHATFYQRVYEIGPDIYAPLLATVIPVGGIIGGVGGGLMGDWLSRINGRAWLTAGATVAAAPVIAVSLLAPEYQQSFAALLVGFALSEAWRAPAAIMVRDVSPPNLGSTGSAIHLCIRNLLGGAGPLAVASLSTTMGLQRAMLLVPGCYMLSGLAFIVAERLLASEKKRRALTGGSTT